MSRWALAATADRRGRKAKARTRPVTAIPACSCDAPCRVWRRWHCEPGLFGLTGPPALRRRSPVAPDVPSYVPCPASWADSCDTRVLHLSRPRPFGRLRERSQSGVPDGIGIDIADPAVCRFEVEGHPPTGVSPDPASPPTHTRCDRSSTSRRPRGFSSPSASWSWSGEFGSTVRRRVLRAPCERRSVHRR